MMPIVLAGAAADTVIAVTLPKPQIRPQARQKPKTVTAVTAARTTVRLNGPRQQ
jgi:hypothetical protein